MPKNLYSNPQSRIEKLNNQFDAWLKIVTKILILIGAFLALYFGYYEFTNEHYSFREFETPEDLATQGYNGSVVAYQIIDKVQYMKEKTNSLKGEDTKMSHSASMPDVDFNVVGVGISLQATIEYIKNLAGKPTKTISGEITDQDSVLALRLRITGQTTNIFEQSYRKKSQAEALDSLFLMAGGAILKATEPYLYAGFLYSMKQHDLAVSMLRYTLDTPPESDDTWAYNLLGGIMGTFYKDSAVAVENFQKSLALEPDMPVVYGNWALMLRSRKDTAAAIEKYKKGIEIEPNYLEGYVGLGNIYRLRKEYKLAEEMYKKALAIKPNYRSAYAFWATMLQEQGKCEEAIEKRKYILLLEPQRSTNYNNLAYNYYKCKEYDKGMEIIQKGLKIDPNDAYCYSTLAELCEAKGDTSAFFKNMEIGVRKGWKLSGAIKTEPYKRYAEIPRLKEILALETK